MSTKLNRRKFLGTAALAALAGCTDSGDDSANKSSTDGASSDGGDGSDNSGSAGYSPMFRKGIRRTGYVPDESVPDSIQLDWMDQGVNKWTHTAAKGSPTVHDGDIYIGGDTGAVFSFTMDGDVNWATATWPSSKGIHGTPAVHGDTVYIGAYDGAMYAFSRKDGGLKWRTRIGDAIGSSPAYYDGKIYVSVETYEPSGIMSVLDAETGEILWKDTRVTNHPHSSVALDPETGIMTVGANDGILYAWDMESYEFLWKFDVRGTKSLNRNKAIKGPILAYDGAAFFGSWDQYIYRIDLETGKEDWVFEADDLVMSGAGVDPRTSKIYIGSHDHHIYCLDVANGDEYWNYETGGMITGCPVIAGDKVLIGSYDNKLYALDRKTGKSYWSYEANGWVTSCPAIQDGKVIFADRADIDNPERTAGNDAGSIHVLKG